MYGRKLPPMAPNATPPLTSQPHALVLPFPKTPPAVTLPEFGGADGFPGVGVGDGDGDGV